MARILVLLLLSQTILASNNETDVDSPEVEIKNSTYRDPRNGILGLYFNPNDPLSRLAASAWTKLVNRFPNLNPPIPWSIQTTTATTTTPPTTVTTTEATTEEPTISTSKSSIVVPSPNPPVVHPGSITVPPYLQTIWNTLHPQLYPAYPPNPNLAFQKPVNPGLHYPLSPVPYPQEQTNQNFHHTNEPNIGTNPGINLIPNYFPQTAGFPSQQGGSNQGTNFLPSQNPLFPSFDVNQVVPQINNPLIPSGQNPLLQYPSQQQNRPNENIGNRPSNQIPGQQQNPQNIPGPNQQGFSQSQGAYNQQGLVQQPGMLAQQGINQQSGALQPQNLNPQPGLLHQQGFNQQSSALQPQNLIPKPGLLHQQGFNQQPGALQPQNFIPQQGNFQNRPRPDQPTLLREEVLDALKEIVREEFLGNFNIFLNTNQTDLRTENRGNYTLLVPSIVDEASNSTVHMLPYHFPVFVIPFESFQDSDNSTFQIGSAGNSI
ncbi:unnamed protein product [Allacma fusca]|uniref:Uncharacterized protein n=1 Tax=Allacma fusca TaxID=39272 RepID=A0A8J2K1I7_9HEXA|nr:unnamed protein product [Allacma fusca]